MNKISIDNADTINLGNLSAPHQLTIIVNLSCRYCKKWWRRNHTVIDKGLLNDRLSVHLKLWTKDKPALRIGNIAHQYVDFKHPNAAYQFIQNLIQNQNEFKRYQESAVPTYLMANYGVQPVNSPEQLLQSTAELEAAGVRGIPTIVLDGEWHDQFTYRLPENIN